MRPLLVVDADSFAHRAYHALPKSMRRGDGGPAGLLIGLFNALVRLWEEERPRAVVTCWDTLTSPTYRHLELPTYQGGREFDQELLEQLALAPTLADRIGFAVAKGAGYEADDFVAASVAFEEARGGTALVASGDRDMYQLVSEQTTVLQPQRGGGPFARIDPDGVRERYGIDPAQVPDFIALRGDPSDKIPGARGIGEKTGADLLRRYGTLEAAIADGRFETEAESLRLYLRIATMDGSAPLPPIDDTPPDWGRGADLAHEWGLGGLEGKLRGLEASSSS